MLQKPFREETTMHRNRSHILKRLLLGLLAAVVFTLLAMLVLAGILMIARIGDGLLRTLNQLVKLLAVVIGVCVAVPRGSQRGLATGVLIALAYAALGYALYVALGGARFSVTAMLGEMLAGSAAGAVTGCIRANMASRRRTAPRPVKPC